MLATLVAICKDRDTKAIPPWRDAAVRPVKS